MLERLFQDIRFGARMLAKRKGVTAVAVLSLALGIGANTAIFSVVDAVLFTPLPYGEPERLVRLWETFRHPQGRGRGSVSLPNMADWREQSTVFEGIGGYSQNSVALGFEDGPDRVRGAFLTPEVMPLLAVDAAHGRPLVAEDTSDAAVVVLSHELWRSRFGGDPAVVGSTVRFDGEPFEIVGVMPDGFDFPARSETRLWAPLRLPESIRQNRGSHRLATIARLKPETNLAAAAAEMEAIAARLAELYPEVQTDRGALVLPLAETIVGSQRTILMGLWAAVALVLLIACANVANLLLARAGARRREMAIRTALGAGRLRLIRQSLTESVLLALAGGGAGWFLGTLMVATLARLPGTKLPADADLRTDPQVLGYTLVISLAAAFLAGLMPALRGSRIGAQEALRGRAADTGGRRDLVREGLVVAEVALALVVLIGAGLMVRTLWHLLETESGMQEESVLTTRIALPAAKYGEEGATGRFWQRLLEESNGLPGVERVGLISHLPLQNWGYNGEFQIQGREPLPPGQRPFSEFRVVGGDYFRTLGIPILNGRDFDSIDTEHSPTVALINQTLAERHWPGEDPFGRRITFSSEPTEDDWITILGVVRDVRNSGLDEETRPEMYFSLRQAERRQLTFVARTAVPPESVIPSLRATVTALDPDLPVFQVLSLEQVAANHLAGRRFDTQLIAVFGILALLLAMAGVFGVLSYTVSRRTHEMGLRMALGARALDVQTLVLRQGLLLVIVGTLLGSGLAWAGTRWLESRLVGIAPTDPLSYAGAALLVLVIAVMATWWPAHRAGRVSPTVALREE